MVFSFSVLDSIPHGAISEIWTLVSLFIIYPWSKEGLKYYYEYTHTIHVLNKYDKYISWHSENSSKTSLRWT